MYLLGIRLYLSCQWKNIVPKLHKYESFEEETATTHNIHINLYLYSMKVSKIRKIVLSSRTRDQLGLDQNTWLANNWQQVAK